jgi:TPR repeat protein
MSNSNHYLTDLEQYRNNPELARNLTENALQGDKYAQYALGLIYIEGRAVDADPVESYAWLTAAMLQGDENAFPLRNMVAELMTNKDIYEAEERAGIIMTHEDGFDKPH